VALVIDTGPLFALLDRDDRDHGSCRLLLENAQEALIVPSPVLVEVEYLARRSLGLQAVSSLLADVVAGNLLIEDLEAEDYERVLELTQRYSDSDIGFVDAAVLAVVERLGEPKLATLDRRHFGLLRPRHVEALRLLPA
jgi:predicted nucleic acid-binding protein